MRWLLVDDEHHRALRGRVQRLATVSAVSLGILWWFGREADTALATSALAAGWILMPAVLVASLAVPRLKFGLAVPATLVSLSTAWLALDTFPAPGWLLVSSGIMLGAAMGAWFWFRWAPIPARLEAPGGRARTALMVVHVSLVLAGMAILAVD